MRVFLQTRWVLLVVLIVFTAVKIPHLFYPYYWDESWPYAAAIKEMYHHGVSLMPSAINPDLSKGHPLLFHSLAASWMHIFGASHLAMHSFALLTSLVLLTAVYEAGLKLFNLRVASLSIILISVQVIFYVQSSFVLPEILVALLAFLSLYYYSSARYFAAAISLTALFFTKESGIVAGVVTGIDAGIGLLDKNTPLKIRIAKIITVLVPSVLLGLFFVIQKHVNGWYLNPEHTKLMVSEWRWFWYYFRTRSMHSALLLDNRNFYFIGLLVLSLIAALKNKSFKYLVLFFPAVIIYYFADDMRSGRPMPSVPFFCLFLISVAWMFYVLRKLKIFPACRQEKFIMLYVLFIILFFCFSAINFFTPRYMLAGIVPLLFFASVIFDSFITRTYPVLVYPVVLLIAVICGYTFSTNAGYGDNDPGAYDAMSVQQSVVDFLEKNNAYDKPIGCGSFLENQHFMSAATGFLSSEKVFTKVSWEIDGNTQYAIFDNIEPENRYDEIRKNPAFHLVYRPVKGRVWAEIYEHR
jgi:hypothetical protein